MQAAGDPERHGGPCGSDRVRRGPATVVAVAVSSSMYRVVCTDVVRGVGDLEISEVGPRGAKQTRSGTKKEARAVTGRRDVGQLKQYLAPFRRFSILRSDSDSAAARQVYSKRSVNKAAKRGEAKRNEARVNEDRDGEAAVGD